MRKIRKPYKNVSLLFPFTKKKRREISQTFLMLKSRICGRKKVIVLVKFHFPVFIKENERLKTQAASSQTLAQFLVIASVKS